jgi:hypothetical protein
MRYPLGIMLLCLTALVGCANNTLSVNSTTITPTTSVVASPTSPNATGLETLDWANTSYPDLCHMNNGSPVTVVNGMGPLSNNGVRLQVFDPLFGFITRTNQVDAIIPYGCIGIMDSGVSILVYAGNAINPVIVGHLPLAASQYPLASVFTENIRAHKLELSGVGFSSGAVPQCCPDVWVTDTYAWNGNAFTMSGHQATTLGKQLLP